LSAWADKIILDNEVYYFASKNKAVSELPFITKNIDTMYRHYKSLSENNLIEIKKIGGKDYVKLTEKGKTWNEFVGKKSERSEKNPSEVGKKSELRSEKNPTYNNYNSNKETRDNIYITKNKKFEIKYQKQFYKQNTLPPKEDEEFNSLLEWLFENTPKIVKCKRTITGREFIKLKKLFSKSYMKDMFERMENSDKFKKTNWAYKTFLNWAKRDGAYKPK